MRFEFRWSALLVVGIMAAGTAHALGWGDALWTSAAVVTCLLLHEGAHIAVARGYAVPVKTIGISAKGGYTVRQRATDPRIEFRIALAGPAMNMLLWASFAALPGKGMAWLAECNLILATANLIPIAPSDGWRIWKLLTHSLPVPHAGSGVSVQS